MCGRAVVCESAESIVQGTIPCFEKDADTLRHPASLVKLLTMYVARRVQPNTDQQVRVLATDEFHGKKHPKLLPDDVLSLADLYYLAALPSHNAAARILARASSPCGGKSSENAYECFLGEMRGQMEAWNWDGAVVACASGLRPESRLTARWINQLLFRIHHEDEWLLGVLGSQERTVNITGPNPRSIRVAHTLASHASELPPHLVAGKTGTIGGKYGSLALLTMEPDNVPRATTILRSAPENMRYADLRAILRGANAVDAPMLRSPKSPPPV